MRYQHTATRAAKETFLNHLSFIIEELNVKTTQRELAMLCQVSVSTIGAIKNGRGKNVSFETILRVADAIRLSYQVTLTSKFGKSTYSVTCEAGYDYMKTARVKITEQGRIIRSAKARG
ncbi:HTH DNA binding protein [Erwinia phage vB_EamM_ChrisDB]|jgi:transcriptional regulator with XRE-family HTH domain|uniref:HTH DNA binding protein n=1 Tax=Erwinia phage vB_EamM_ChrisDB TaxID=1883371 RepID=UPI00081D237E|nr:HTH DNA binding protein [Erwinia phage vB_EamM_ChrisDB]ANZ48679.1 putative transcriptional regulator [Erwinia phage vB_EamM_ChrisDB]